MILDIRISLERNMIVAERFIKSLIRKYGKHNISTYVERDIHRHADSLTWNITCIPQLKGRLASIYRAAVGIGQIKSMARSFVTKADD